MKTRPERLRLLITAGPTQEALDPIRFLSNYSTGKTGYEIARLAQKRGHDVTLISGPTNLAIPPKVRFIPIKDALSLKRAVERNFNACDCLIMTAAVSDFRPSRLFYKKMKRRDKPLYLKLEKNPDILKEIGKRKKEKILVGFALETENLFKNALAKLKDKNLDLVVANQLKNGNSPFGDKRVSYLIINRKGEICHLKNISKARLARLLLDRIESFWYGKCKVS